MLAVELVLGARDFGAHNDCNVWCRSFCWKSRSGAAKLNAAVSESH